LNRRELLKSLGLGLSAGCIVPSLLTSCGKNDPGPEISYDGTVAIIGAGVAGLYAADILNAKGINIFVLEADKQMGGRIRSLRNQNNYQELFGQDTVLEFGSDFPLELGADVYYGSDSLWGKTIDNFKIPTQELSSGNDRFILENLVKTAEEWNTDSDFASVKNFVANLKNYSGAAQSIQQAANVSVRARTLLNGQAGNFFGSSIEKIGASLLGTDLKKRTHDGKAMLIKANPMQDILLSRFSNIRGLVQTETPVTSINYAGDLITIKDKSGKEYQANKVIVTVPLAVLKNSGITFSPGLPTENSSALTKFGMDASIRVVMEFKKNLWGENTGYIWGGAKLPQILNTGVGRSVFYRTLSFTINGSAASTLSAMTRDQQLTAILAELDAVYDGQASAFVRKDLNNNRIVAAIKDWSKEEYIKGGYSYPLVSASATDRTNLSKPISNKIYFAGEATDIGGDAGTINGALASAERVTKEIIESIVKV
jgi:monoamine oxidase